MKIYFGVQLFKSLLKCLFITDYKLFLPGIPNDFPVLGF